MEINSGILIWLLQLVLVHGKQFKISSVPYLSSTNTQFNSHIEGINVGPSGKIYATQFGPNSNSLGQLYPIQKEIYTDKNSNSYFNGMHFYNQSVAFVVDSSDNQRLLKIEFDGNGSVVGSKMQCTHNSMLPLNDVAISFKTGRIFISAMNWTNTSTSTDGQIWVCSLYSTQAQLLHVMGGVNGIELSVDEKTLFTTETFTRDWIHVSSKIWKFDIQYTKQGSFGITNKNLFVNMANVANDSVGFAMDGIKVDVAGNVLAVRYGGSSVAIFSSAGGLIGRIHLNFKNPTNMELVQIRGQTHIFICGGCSTDGETNAKASGGCVDTVQWPWNGRSFQRFFG